MKYSSHLFYHTDGTIDHFPIVELDEEGHLVNVKCNNELSEAAGIKFFAGIIVPQLISYEPFEFHSKEDFCIEISKRIDNNNPDRIMLIEGFDLNTFDYTGMSIKELG